MRDGRSERSLQEVRPVSQGGAGRQEGGAVSVQQEPTPPGAADTAGAGTFSTKLNQVRKNHDSLCRKKILEKRICQWMRRGKKQTGIYRPGL